MKPVVLVVRQCDRFGSLLNEAGFETINLPLVRTEEVADLSKAISQIAALDNYDGVFLTSPAAARVFLQRLEGKGFGGKIYVLGRRIRRLFETAGIETVYLKDANTIAEFLNSFPAKEFAGKKFLFPRGDRSLRTIPDALTGIAEIDEIVVYRSIKPEVDEKLLAVVKERLALGEITAVCFFSPSGVVNFLETLGEFSQKNIKIAAIGATTARAAESENLRIDFVSPRANAEDFAVELAKYLKNLD